jgi:hypothetical protein
MRAATLVVSPMAGIQHLVHSLWTEALGEWGGVGDVAELDGNQLALTLDGAAGPQNLGRQDLNDDRSRSRRRMKP